MKNHKEFMLALLNGDTLESKTNGVEIKYDGASGNIIIVKSLFGFAGEAFSDIGGFGNFEIKMNTVTINGIEVPEPHRNPLKLGETYYVASLMDTGVAKYQWKDFGAEYMWLDFGVIHLTEENALKHRAALLAPTMRIKDNGKIATSSYMHHRI
jgi:hypothetical protein